MLDLVFTESNQRLIEINHGPALGKNDKTHLSIKWKYAIKCESLEQQSSLARNYHKTDFESMNQFFDAVEWETLSELPVQSMFDTFLSIYENACERFMPKRRAKRRRKPPWFSPEMKSLKKCKKSAWYKYLSNMHDKNSLSNYNVGSKRRNQGCKA